MKGLLKKLFVKNWEHTLGILLIVLVIIATILRVLFAASAGSIVASQSPIGVLRYVAIGDSYTIGESVGTEDNFPSQLATQLTATGVPTALVANPSRTGFTSREVIALELPVLEGSKPDVATLLVGVNDWVQGVPPEEFKSNFAIILHRMMAAVPSKRIVVITIPDFASTPTGALYSAGRDGHRGVQSFNDIIKREAALNNLPVIDIYPLSSSLGVAGGYVAYDGLHPSRKAYTKWVELILPLAQVVFTQQ